MSVEKDLKEATKGLSKTLNSLILVSFTIIILSPVLYIWFDWFLVLKGELTLFFIFLMLKFFKFIYDESIKQVTKQIEEEETINYKK